MVKPEPPRLWSQPAPAVAAGTPLSPTATIAVIVVAVGALYLGSDILIPLALAILLSFMLAPVVIRLRRLGLGRIPAVLAVVLLLFVALLGLGAIVANQVVESGRATCRPTSGTCAPRSATCASPSRAAAWSSAPRTCCAISARSCRRRPAPPERGAKSRRAQARRRQARAGAGPGAGGDRRCRRCASVGGPLVAPIATAGLVVVFVIFMLLQREDLRDRVLRLVGARDVARATEAMDDAAKRISRYLLMQLIINVLYGIPVGIGLYFLGVPNPILWGLLATVLRFIPYLGPVIAALFPIALSFAVAPGWTLPLLTDRAVRHAGAVQQQRARALAVRLEHRAFAGRGPGRRGVLDHALGPGRPAAVDAAHRLPGRARPPCPPARFLPRAAGRRAGARPRGQVLPAAAGARPGGGDRAGRGVSGGRARSTSSTTRSSCRRSGSPSRTGCAAVSIGQRSRASPRTRSASSRSWRKTGAGAGRGCRRPGAGRDPVHRRTQRPR